MAGAGLAADKKGARRTRRTIAFLDETGHTFRARVGTTWAPVGHAPVLRRISKRRECRAWSRSPPRWIGTGRGSIRGISSARSTEPRWITALRYFRARIGRPLVIVWDHLSAHRSVEVRDFLSARAEDFQVEWLPGYAPELNPDEQCNNCVKLAMLNAVPESVEALRHLARINFIRLGRKPHLINHFFHHAGLSVT